MSDVILNFIELIEATLQAGPVIRIAVLAVFGTIIVFIFLVARAIVLWYWRINQLIDRQDRQIVLMESILHELSDMKPIPG